MFTFAECGDISNGHASTHIVEHNITFLVQLMHEEYGEMLAAGSGSGLDLIRNIR